MSELDRVDDCMKALGLVLNLLDPDGSLHQGANKEVLPEKLLREIMQKAKEEYRKLSDAILALRDEEKEEETYIDFAEHLPPADWKSSLPRTCSLTAACLSCHAEMHGEWEGESPYTLVCPSCGQSYTIEERIS